MFGKFVLLFLVWIGLTNSLHYQELIVGVLTSLFVTYYFTGDEKINLFKLLMKYGRFLPLFFKDLIIANIELAKIILNPKLKINPAIITLDVGLENDFDKLILANAITLTPGTITIDVQDKLIYIHILNLKTKDKDLLQKEIIDRYEALLQKSTFPPKL